MLKIRTFVVSHQNWILFGFGLFGILSGILGLYFTSDPIWIKFFDNLHWTSGTLTAAILSWSSYREFGRQRFSPRFWFMCGFGSYAAGQLIWDGQALLAYSHFPSPSDAFYLWLGPCLTLALISEIRGQRHQNAYKIILLDTLSLTIAALTLVLVIYLPHQGETDPFSMLVLIAYPVSLLVVTSTGLMMIPSLRLKPSFSLLLFIIAILVTAWSWMRWNLLALRGSTYDGDYLNVSFSIAILVGGFSTTFWKLEEWLDSRWDSLCEAFLRFLPLVNVLLASLAVIMVTADNHQLRFEEVLCIIGALAVILLAILRQGILLEEREQLLQTQALLRSVLDTVPLRIFWKNRNSRYLGCNRALARDAGLENPEDMIGKDDYQFTWREQAALYQADDQEVMDVGLPRLNYEEPQTTPDGQLIWLRTSKVPLRNVSGQVTGLLGVYDDITLIKGYQDKLKLMAKVFENTQEAIMITNAQHDLIDVNDAFVRVTGYVREEVLGKNPRLLKSGFHADEFYSTMWQAIEATGHWSGEIWNRKKNGDVYPQWITISALYDDGGALSHYVGICSDISLLKQHERQLEHIAHYDALTGVPNRVLLVDRMKQAIAQTRRDHKLLAISYLDLDGFKPINDGYGHHTGDQVLIKLAERIARTIREGDTIARLGGDEFVILLLGQERPEECFASLERLLKNIAQPIIIDNQVFVVTASIGLTIYPLDDHDPDTLLRHADHAMYRAKQSGKNCFSHYDALADQSVHLQQQLFKEISDGLHDNQFELFYQPKVSMIDNRVMGAEALIRWFHPQNGLLSPIAFLPPIENTPLEIELGDWVIDHALAQIQHWLQLGYSIPVSVNITGQQLLEAEFVNKLIAALAKYPAVSHRLLELEILETTALEIERLSSVILSTCAEVDVSFALDDFGTGYSTLTYLKQLPVSILKIDQSFVHDMLEDQGDRAIVEGVIALAKVFGRVTVAEGVETEQHFQMLQTMGCQMAQGYGIARPMPAKEFLQWYREHEVNTAKLLID